MQIQPSTPADLTAILAIYDQARQFMAASGNPGQWIKGYPQRERVLQDIQAGHSYVALEASEIVAVFYFAVETEPTYASIRSGQWLNDQPYGVVHRIASASRQRGLAAACLNWCFAQHPNIRLDTHRDNLPMRRLMQKLGYQYCGIIQLADGAERLAYQKIASEM